MEISKVRCRATKRERQNERDDNHDDANNNETTMKFITRQNKPLDPYNDLARLL